VNAGADTPAGNVVLYAPAVYGVDFLFMCIEVACRASQGTLTSGTPSAASGRADIVLLPVPRSFRTRLGDLATVVAGSLPTVAREWFLASMPARASDTVRARLGHPGSIYGAVKKGCDVRLRVEGVDVSIHALRLSWQRKLCLAASSFVTAVRFWLSAIRGGRFVAHDFLTLRYQGVDVGRFAASDTLRWHWELGASLRATPTLFAALVDAIYLCKVSAGVSLDPATVNLVMVPDLTYVFSVYEGSLADRGAGIVTLYSYKSTFRILRSGSVPVHPEIAEPPGSGQIDLEAADRYLQERIEAPGRLLPYMSVGVNEPPRDAILTLDGRLVAVDDRKLSVVIFLHSVQDAQYSYGLDGFNDLVHWTTYTIDKCLANAQIDKVLVKMHPNIDFGVFGGEKVAFDQLIARYRGCEKCVFVKSTTSLVDLARACRMYGITHHGSVAEEFVFLGQPVISSVLSPWGENYRFTRTWATPAELSVILESLSFETWAPPDEFQKRELAAFVSNYRFNYTDYRKRSPWRVLAEWLDGAGAAEMTDAYSRYTEMMEQMRVDDPECARFLSMLCTRSIGDEQVWNG